MAQFDVETFIDNQRVGWRQIVVLTVCTLVCFIDGFDVFMVGKVLPAIAADLGETPAAMRSLIFYQQIGLAIGAFAIAPFADRIGRRATLAGSLFLFGLLTLGCVFTSTLTELTAVRSVAAIFMSAGLPMAVALIAEVAPRHRRGMFIAIAMAGYSAGSASGGAVAAFLVDSYGWESGFWIGGIVPLVLIPLLLFLVPESLKFRVERNPADPTIPAALRQFDPSVDLTGQESFVLGAAKPQKAKLTDIFTDGRALMTAILWTCFFLSMSNIALLAAWLPTFFQEMAGIPFQRFALFAMIAFGGGFAGTLVTGYLLDKVRPSWMIAGLYVGLAAMLVTMANVPFGTPLFLAVLIAWSFFQTGGQSSLNTLTTTLYPPRMRSTGLGWGGGAGRIGGIAIAPAFGGWALSQELTLQTTLTLVAIPSLVVAVLVLALGRITERDERVPTGAPVTA